MRILTAETISRTKGTAKKNTLVRYTETRVLPPGVKALQGLTPHAYKRALVSDAERTFGIEAASEFGGNSVRIAQQHYVRYREGDLRILNPMSFRVEGEPEEDDRHDEVGGNDLPDVATAG